MKHLLSIIIALTAFSMGAVAQQPKFSKKDFRAQQEAFITCQASLTTQEAKLFFPLYFELQDKKEAYNRKAWDSMKKGNEDGLTEAEYNDIITGTIQSRIATDKLDLEYLKKYKKFLSAKKIFDIQRAEMKFHRELLKPRPHQKKNNKQ